MRFYTVLASRPAYYDRNASPLVSSYGAASIAPHTDTVRWTYTVPSGKKTYVQSMLAELMRDSAAGAAAIADAYVLYAPLSGGSAGVAFSEELTNTVGGPNRTNFAATGLMVTGDVITGHTKDASTTGTYSYHVNAWYVEFDA